MRDSGEEDQKVIFEECKALLDSFFDDYLVEMRIIGSRLDI